MQELAAKAASLAVAVAVPFLGSLAKQRLIRAEESHFNSCAGGQAARNKGKTWKRHSQLRNAWPVVYALLGAASWLVWRQGGAAAQAGALGRYACLLTANLLCWPPVFFGGHSPLFAALDCTVLLLAMLLTIPRFYAVDPVAGMLLLPYLGWTCFASTLINCSLLSGNAQVVSRVEQLTAAGRRRGAQAAGAAGKAPDAAPAPQQQQQQAQARASSDRRSGSVLRLDVPRGVSDAATSPFYEAAASVKSPLTQAKDLLGQMSETLAGDGTAADPASAEYLRSGIARVNSLLSKVSVSFQGAGGALAEGRGPSGALARVGSLLSRVSMSLQRGGSGQAQAAQAAQAEREAEAACWPTSDSIPTTFFSCPGPAGFKVRGANYLSDKQKVVPEGLQGRLVSLNLVRLREPTFHIARFLPSVRNSKAPFIFVWQVMVPGRTHVSLTVAWALDSDPTAPAHAHSIPEGDEDALAASPSPPASDRPEQPAAASPAALPALDSEPAGRRADELRVQLSSKSTGDLAAARPAGRGHRRTATTLCGVGERASVDSAAGEAAGAGDAGGPRLAVPEGAAPFDAALARFLDGGGGEAAAAGRRHAAFKIIPRIEKGGWVVKQAVGQNTPVLLGRKLTTKYFRGPRYVEADTDVGSSTTAASVVGLVQGALKTLVIDIAVLLEGKSTEELPEELIGTVRLEHLDLSQAAELDLTTGEIMRKS